MGRYNREVASPQGQTCHCFMLFIDHRPLNQTADSQHRTKMVTLGVACRLGHETRHFNIGRYRRMQSHGTHKSHDAAFFDNSNAVSLALLYCPSLILPNAPGSSQCCYFHLVSRVTMHHQGELYGIRYNKISSSRLLSRVLQEGKARRAEALNAALSDMESWLSSGKLLPT